jgi:CheY-like chemotaxis protein
MQTLDWNDVTTWQVLVADDEPDNLEVVAETLEFRGATVQTTKNGEDAVATLEKFEANLLLLDLSMPKMDGWQTRATIRQLARYQHLVIIAMTAHAMIGDRERAMAAGFDGYVTKPINVRTVTDDIRNSYKAHYRADQRTLHTAPHKETTPL